MNRRFVALLAGLEAKSQELLAMTPVAAAQVRSGWPKGGVYLFSEGRVHLYVGRTKRRYVGEPEPLRQTLLETYVAVAADAKYNDFSPH